MDPLFSGRIDLDQLLLRKQLEPLSESQIRTLQHIQDYPASDVAGFSEADAREYIIAPMLRVLGYDKGTPFSTSLETHLTFLGQGRRSDYHLQLWKESFWLLEAKKPQIGIASFGYDDFAQALEYSVHPTVDAALIVLCDGLKLEIFDREVSVAEPILRVEIKELVANFDKIRLLLEPMQVWFFQKRRVLRLLDRVFDHEFVMSRVDEFSELIQRRLNSKRDKVIENFRREVKPDSDEQREAAENASLSDLDWLYLMYDFPTPISNAVNRGLIALSLPNSFSVMHRLLPDRPRPVTNSYMAQMAGYLAGLAKQPDAIVFLPAWLAREAKDGNDLPGAIRFFLDQCLTAFKGHIPYRIILLAACAIWRVSKISVIALDVLQDLGQQQHALSRFMLPEVSWAQVVASPDVQRSSLIDRQGEALLRKFVQDNTAPDGSFKAESAKHQLRGWWDTEKRMLVALPNYPGLLKERSLGDMRMTEWGSVTYDMLGHSTLAALHRFPEWKAYLLTQRRELIEEVAATGSSLARELLGLKPGDALPQLSDEALAEKFFIGDIETLSALRKGYGG
jgi:hypothetical protein